MIFESKHSQFCIKTGGVLVLLQNVVIFPTDLTLTGSEFHRVGAATQKAVVPTFVLALGTKSRLELDD